MLGEFVFGILGVCFGSFGNVLIYRLSKNVTLRGRSRCGHCKHTLSAADLVPVLSYIVLGGKCRYCKKSVSMQYPLVEAISGALFIAAYVAYPFEPVMALLISFVYWLFFLIAVFDLRTSTIPDALSIPVIVLAVISQGIHGQFPVLAMLVGVLFFGLQWAVSKGAWVGTGDIFLAAGIGAFLGTPFLMCAALFFAYIFGAVVASYLLVTGVVSRKAHIPFGPFLVLGMFAVHILQARLEFIASVWF